MNSTSAMSSARAGAARVEDPAEIEKIVIQLLPRVRNLVRYLVRGDENVERLAQDALVKVLERLSSLRGHVPWEPWVDRSVLRVTLANLRELAADTGCTLRDCSNHRVSVPVETPNRYVSRRQVVAALDRLPDDQRHALVMHHVLGMSVPEIALELAEPLETVRSRLKLDIQRDT